MIKKFLVVLVAFVTVFLTQSQVWAAVNNSDKVHETISVDKSTFMSNESPAMLAAKLGSGGTNSILWIASIFIPGLGQILMGDVGRGLKFLIIEAALLVANIIIPSILVAGSAATGSVTGFGLAGIIGLIIWIAFLAVHIWNIIDAYQMSQEVSGMSKLNDVEIGKLEKQLNDTMALARSVKVSDNGTVSVTAFAF